MAIIAIIDDAINEMFLRNSQVKKRIIVQEETGGKAKDYKANFCTHATTCAMILEIRTTDYEIINIQIMRDSNTPANIDDMAEALQMCLDLEVDIISMSIGTVKLSESIKLNGVISKLARRKVIMVAALSNKQYLTLPAFYPEVIGVQCDTKEFMKPMEIAVNQYHWLGVQVIANCSLDFAGRQVSFYPSNSFAVPVVVSYINEIINQWKDSKKGKVRYREEILCELEKYSSTQGKQKVGDEIEAEMKKLEGYQNTIPHVCMIVQNQKDVQLSKGIITFLNQQHKIETAGFTWGIQMEDIRFWTLENDLLSPGIMEAFIDRYMEAELIFSILYKEEFQNLKQSISPDLIIYKKRNQTDFIGDGENTGSLTGGNENDAKAIGNEIVKVLS